MKKFSVVLLSLLALLPGLRAAPLFDRGAAWRWRPGTNEASAPVGLWRANGFNDASFITTPAPFWYGDLLPGGTEITGMQNVYGSLFLRKTFVVSNAAEVAVLRLGAMVDDGFVAWINGIEVQRVNMTAAGAPGTAVTIATLADNAAEPPPFLNYDLPNPSAYLVTGTNVISIQVFQSAVASSDLGFDASLETLLVETVPPTILSVDPAAGTLTNLVQLTVTFSESVTGVDAADLLVNGASALIATPISSSGYTFTFQQPAYGSVSLGWRAGHNIADQALPPNPFNATGPGATWIYNLVDNTLPAVDNLSPAAGASVKSLSSINVLFTEPVSGVEAADLLINNTPAASVAAVTSSQFIFTFTEPATGTVQVAWVPGHGIFDQAAVPNAFAGGSWTYRLDPNAAGAPPYISEFMASNTRTNYTDENRQSSDWIEIYNPGGLTVNLDGWSLTDSVNNLTKWRFPATNLAGGGFLVVFASGNDRRIPGARLHTSFQLSTSGEYLALVKPDGSIASEFRTEYPPQVPDVSYGFAQFDSGSLLTAGTNGVYFTAPTPGAANLGGVNKPGPVIENVQHTPNVPLDNQDLLVTARVQPSFLAVAGVSMRYRIMFSNEVTTTMFDDGAHGDGAAGDGIFGATIPAHLSTNGQMIRYLIAATDVNSNGSRWPLFTTTNNHAEYLGTVVDPSYVTSKLPIFHLFAPPTVLQPGPITTQLGADSEAGGRVAIFYDGEFYDNIYMELRGNTSATLNKKAHRIEFNREHEFRHAGPGGRTRKSALLGEYLDPAYLRQHLCFWFLDQIGVKSPYDYPVRLQLNGAFYQLAFHNDVIGQEQVERLGYDPRGALYKAVGTFVTSRFSTGVFQKLEPDESPVNYADYTELSGGIAETAAVAVRRNTVFDMLDLPQVINHLAGTRWCAENDDVWANMSMYRDTFGDRLWRNIPFDMNASWGQLYGGSNPLEATVDTSKSHPLYGGLSTQQGNWNRLYDVIVTLPETRAMLLRRQRSIMDQMIQPPGTPTNSLIIENYIKYMTNLISAEANLDRTKWGFSPWAAGKTFNDGVGDLLNQFVGPRRRHWYATHSITNTSRVIGINPANSAGLPLAQPDSASLLITSIEFNPASALQAQEYLCLTNPTSIALDISGWRLDGAVSFTFQEGTVVPSNSVVYVSPDVVAFRARTTGPRAGQGLFIVGPYQGSLDARGEVVQLLDATGRLVHSNAYFGTPSLAQQYLRITEIMYHPGPTNVGSSYGQEEFEYLELKNIGPVALNLVGIHFTNGLDFAFTAAGAVTNLTPGQVILLVRNPAAFIARHGAGAPIAGTFAGSLDNSGERLRLDDAVGEQILDFSYNNSWYPITDGLGFSLVIVDANAPFNTWDEKPAWRASGSLNGSPGQNEPAAPAFVPVRVNEVLANSTLPEVDAIELWNNTTNLADIGGWWISDDFFTPFKYRVPASTIIMPGGYRVFTEAQFNPGGPGFAFSAGGDEVYLFSADGAGNLTGYYHGFGFGASAPGVTLGRYVTSDGDEHFVAQKTPTLTNANSGPKVGPVVISEIMYHPPDVGGVDNARDEFIELQNISAGDVPLFDPTYPTNRWKLDDAVNFPFPTNTVIPAGGYLVVVSFDPATNAPALAAFRAQYNLGLNVPIVGPYSGQLDNSEDSVELKKPDTSVLTNITSVLVDRVRYKDVTPWADGADGVGASLQRLVLADFGNDATNWSAALPSPGQGLPGGTIPAMTQQPAPATVFVAGSAATSPLYVVGTTSFVAVASGPGLRYQWRFNSGALPGATNATLVLTNIQFSDAGNYSLVAYNNAGSVISANAVLTVYAPLTIVVQPASQNVPAGTTVNLGVLAVGVGPLRYQWRFEGVNIAGATNANHSFSGANLTLNGNYSCRVQDDIGSVVSSNAFIYAPPVYFTLQPPGQNVLPGTNVTINSLALGFGPVRYQWQYEGVDIPNATNTSYSFSNASLGSHGNYRVIATDSLGTGTSSNAFIFVLIRPGLVSHPIAQTVLQGGTARFSVIATGAPPLYFRWLRNGSLWVSNQSPDLVITNCQSNGTFRVTVGNVAGTANSVPAGGVALLVLADLDRDGMADAWETNYFGLGSTNDPGNALLDSDGDGMINRDEYVAGTNPTNALSLLKIILSTTNTGTLQFVAQTNIGYTVQGRTDLALGAWLNLSNIAAQSQVRTVELNAAGPPTVGDRFYRIVTPIVP